MIPQKVQLNEQDLEQIEVLCLALSYASKSEYMRTAIQEKIRADQRKLREMKRRKAMEAYGLARFNAAFEDLEAADFEAR